MGSIGPLEIAIVAIIALVVFGPKRLPELGNSLGKGMREFKSSISGEDDHNGEEASQARIAVLSQDHDDRDRAPATPERRPIEPAPDAAPVSKA